ncbi:MAG: EutN/CcmL family microcompartment protein [Arenicellales bacterium]
MHLARVIGTVVSARKDERLEGSKLLLLDPLSTNGDSNGTAAIIAVDTVGAGVEEAVIYVTGSSARRAVGSEDAPTDAAVVGIVDHWDANGRTHQGI